MMNRIKFTTYYPNLNNEPYSKCYDLIELIFDDEADYLHVERKYYLTNNETEIIRGTALVKDLVLDYDPDVLYSMCIGIRACVEYCYKEELFIDGDTSYDLCVINIDDEEYKVTCKKIKDLDYEDIKYFIDQCCIFNKVPTQILKEILSNGPFKQ